MTNTNTCMLYLRHAVVRSQLYVTHRYVINPVAEGARAYREEEGSGT